MVICITEQRRGKLAKVNALVFLPVSSPLCFHCHYSVCVCAITLQSLKATQTSQLSVALWGYCDRTNSSELETYTYTSVIKQSSAIQLNTLTFFITFQFLLFCAVFIFGAISEPQSCQMPICQPALLPPNSLVSV